MRITPRAELDRRLARFQALLSREGLDGALLLQRADLFYFSGTTQQAHLFVPAAGAPLLMVRKSFRRAQRESALESIVPLRSLRDLPGLLADHGHGQPERLGMELDVLPANLYFRYQKLLSKTELVDVSPLVRRVRMTKSPYEVEIQRQAARLLDRVMRQVGNLVHEGMTELELAGELEAVARREGHQGEIWMRNWNQTLFYGHILAGESGAVVSYLDGPLAGAGLGPAMPHGPSLRPIRRGEPIIVDYVAAYDGYLVDQTRVFALGHLSDRWMAAYEAMLAIQATVREAARPGALCADLYDLAVAKAGELGYAEHFMGHGEGRVSFVGHGVGIELDELPVLARGVEMPLEAGMVFALEPKVAFPGEGAIGIENTWLVTEEGLEPLTVSDERIIIL
ncbi:MAG TPA: aminopeptidase P family protein [Anaerolineae bacterium]|nr:aminopeptidase P family protein [Anaerolineae bacterium]